MSPYLKTHYIVISGGSEWVTFYSLDTNTNRKGSSNSPLLPTLYIQKTQMECPEMSLASLVQVMTLYSVFKLEYLCILNFKQWSHLLLLKKGQQHIFFQRNEWSCKATVKDYQETSQVFNAGWKWKSEGKREKLRARPIGQRVCWFPPSEVAGEGGPWSPPRCMFVGEVLVC